MWSPKAKNPTLLDLSDKDSWISGIRMWRIIPEPTIEGYIGRYRWINKTVAHFARYGVLGKHAPVMTPVTVVVMKD